MNQFIYGGNATIEDSPVLDIETLSSKVGGNTGNLAFCYAIARQLKYPPVKSWLLMNSKCFNDDHIGVLTLANQIGEHADLGYFANLLEKHSAKLVGIGLGAQSGPKGTVIVPDGTKRWINIIASRSPAGAPNIGLRGEYTRKILESEGLNRNTIVLGCPTLFISPDPYLGNSIERHWKKHKGARFAVAAGHYKWSHLKKIEQSLVDTLTTFSDYITQSPRSMINLGRGYNCTVSIDELAEINNYLQPNLTQEEFEQWRLNHAITFSSASSWIEYLKRFDLVVGLRIHGVMLALQAGIPGICVVHDSRTRELCQTMLVPYIESQELTKGFTKKDIIERFEFDGAAFDLNRKKLSKRYSLFLEGNKLDYADYIKDIS